MHRAVARYTAPVALLLALTVMPALAAGEAQRVTGGGWIQPSYFDAMPNEPSVPVPELPPDVEEASVFAASKNKKCTFGFVASRTLKAAPNSYEYDGELTYHDHEKGMKLKSLCVDFVDFDPETRTAVFEGEAEVRCPGAPVQTTRFIVTVTDAGEPGRKDTFQIELPYCTLPGDNEEYGACGYLGGGNIQFHD